MSTKINLTYFGMDGQGATVKEAKLDAGRKIEAALAGSYSPVMLQSRGTAVVLWRDPQGWRFNTIAEQGTMRQEAFRSYSSGNDNAGRRLLSEFAHWRGFQLAYKHAKSNGIGEGDCQWHRWACEHTAEFAA